MPIEVFAFGGGLGAFLLPRYLFSHGWALWQCILVGLGVIGIALLLIKRYGMMPPTV